jgi:hypothetical protein
LCRVASAELEKAEALLDKLSDALKDVAGTREEGSACCEQRQLPENNPSSPMEIRGKYRRERFVIAPNSLDIQAIC